MAKCKNCGSKTSTGKRKRSTSKFTEDEKLAYKLGKIQASLGKDCRVNDSYNNGRKASTATKKTKKSLY